MASAAHAQNAWVQEILTQYSEKKYDLVTPRLVNMADLRVFQTDIEKLAPGWMNAKVRPIVPARHAIASFALEAAASHLRQGEAAVKLIEWACRLIQLDPQPDEFDRRWQLASLSLLEGVQQPKALETHLAHIAQQFPDEPRLAFSRALADEQRTAPYIEASSAGVSKIFDSTIQKYTLTLANPSLAAEANLHIGYTELRRQRHNAAIAALQKVQQQTKDPDLIFLAGLFGGQALEGLDHPGDAAAAYRAALQIVPDAHSATTALIALFFRTGRQADAAVLAEQQLALPGVARDPWWDYWAGDFRHANARILALREVIK